MTKRRLAWMAVGALGALVATGAYSPDERQPGSPPRPEPSPIEALDRCIQYRLHDDAEIFGIRRLVDVPQHLFRFEPRRPEESSAVDGLRQGGREVVLYLGSRGLLDRPGDAADDERLGHRTFSKAVAVTGGGIPPRDLPRDLPEARVLRGFGRKALAASAAGEPVVTVSGRWRVDVRPVRADRQACVDCHASTRPDVHGRRLQIGDALGVVVYVSSTRER